jgi:AraC-like DNA-binding protein
MAVSVLLVRAVVEAIERAGVSREALFTGAGLDPRVVDQAEGRISFDEYDALQDVALDLTGDEALGLHMGESATERTHPVVAHLVANAGTFREGIETLLRFYQLVTDRPAWRLEERGDQATLFYEVAPGSPRCKRFRAEITMTGLYRMLRTFARDARPRFVAFEHPEPVYRAEYSRIFDSAERFDQEFTGIVFDRELLGAASLHRDEEFRAVVESQAEKRLSRITKNASYAARVRDYLIDHAIGQPRDMNAAARALGISTRSLRRRLSQEGRSYSDIVDEALATLAKRLLSDDERSIEATAYDMGFSSPSAFHKAFKRWTGTTPKEFRQRRSS